MCFNCKLLALRVFTSKSGEQCRNYNSLYMCLPLLKGPKVMGQLARFVLFPHYHLQGADKRFRVHFKCAICIWKLLLSTLNMRSKELSLSVKQATIRLKKQNKAHLQTVVNPTSFVYIYSGKDGSQTSQL